MALSHSRLLKEAFSEGSRHRELEGNALAEGVASIGAGAPDAPSSAVAGASAVLEASGGAGT